MDAKVPSQTLAARSTAAGVPASADQIRSMLYRARKSDPYLAGAADIIASLDNPADIIASLDDACAVIIANTRTPPAGK